MVEFFFVKYYDFFIIYYCFISVTNHSDLIFAFKSLETPMFSGV